MIKQANDNEVTILASEDYASRISMGDDYSLHVSQASLSDQKIFSCMVVYISNLKEYRLKVLVNSKYLTMFLFYLTMFFIAFALAIFFNKIHNLRLS